MPKVSEQHLAARREQILAGARRAFARHGYEGATVARLEAEIGLSRGAIFHYFPSKKDLFVALARDVDRTYRLLIVERGFAAAVRAMAEESPEWLGVLLETQARLRHDPAFEARMAPSPEDTTLLRDWLAGEQRAGRLRADVDSVDLGRFATMVLNGLALRVVAGDETEVEPTIRLLDDALGPRK